MDLFNIICIDDQREVLAALLKDLDYFKEYVEVSDCESALEAKELLEELDSREEMVPVIICDHVMPVKSGIDFLIEVNKDPRFVKIKKILLTGLATHQDTIKAINQANIDHYFEKPWDTAALIKLVKTYITEYITENDIDYRDYIKIIDHEVLFRKMQKQL